MKHIFLNLKRFDIPKEYGGVNQLAPMAEWGGFIVSQTQEQLKKYAGRDMEFAMYFPEAHVIGAAAARTVDSPVQIGCQSVFREDTAVSGGFGAFTSNRTANAMKAAGCTTTIIGHCEERRDKSGILREAGVTDAAAVGRILNQEMRCAAAAGFNILYCIGETEAEQPRWQEVLREQLETGLFGISREQVVIAYEPVWAIGPGKTPPDRAYIQKIAQYVKEVTGGLDVVYGGGLKTDNAEMLASIPEINGGLIALTRFTGEIGFYPEEYLEIIEKYVG